MSYSTMIDEDVCIMCSSRSDCAHTVRLGEIRVLSSGMRYGTQYPSPLFAIDTPHSSPQDITVRRAQVTPLHTEYLQGFSFEL